MDDAALARRLQAGDRSAWAEVYDRYADRLHDYCAGLLRDPHEAEDALHDAFLTAGDRIGQLRDPERLRPWLYAVCRTTALGRARRRSRLVPTVEVGEVTAAPEVADPVAQAELVQMVWTAAEGLPPQDRAVLDLHLRHGLVGQELAEALDVSPHHAAVRLGRVRELVERSLTVLLVSRLGRRDCPDLDALLAGWDGRLEPRLRKRVARHIDGCEICEERRRTVMSPLALLAAAPLVPAPSALRSRVLDDLGATPRRPGGGRRRAAVVAIAAVLVAGLVAVTMGLASGDDDERGAVPIDATSTSTTSPPTTAAAPSLTVAVVPGSTTSVAPATAPGEGRLTLSSGALHLGADLASAELLLHNDGDAPLRWVAATDLGGVTLGPSHGELGPGQSRTMVVTVDRSTRAEGPFAGQVTVAGTDVERGTAVGGGAVTVDGSTEHPPVLGIPVTDRTFVGVAGPSFCRTSAVRVAVTDESAVQVVLRWSGGGVGATSVPMGRDGGGWVAALGPPADDVPIRWWVDAVDARGNASRSPEHVLEVQPVC